MRNEQAVWITGVGAATPLGHNWQDIADSLLTGRSAVRRISQFDVSEHPSQIGAQLEELPCPPHLDPQDFVSLNRQQQLVLWCCCSALGDAGWWDRRTEVRIGLVMGHGAEQLLSWEAAAQRHGAHPCRPEDDNELLITMARRVLGLSGPVASVSAACASGNHALAQARRWLQLGWVDVCLAGACELGLTPMSLAAFGNLRALSRRNDDPQRASRPFDRGRDGFVMGEGGAMFVLEPASAARRRSAHVYAELAGCGASSDAFNMVIPSSDPAPSVLAMRLALQDAKVNPAEVDYINAHGTSTPVGDASEAKVLESVLGEAVRSVPVSSTKSMTGHLLAAAAAVEALACLIAMERGAVPPTINLDDPDPDCNLCHVPNEARAHKVRVAVSNSFGFGGSNTCLVLKAV